MVKKGHPWVFDKSIVKQSKKGTAGDLAIIFDRKKNKFLACGLFDPHSPIRIRILQVHRPAMIDPDWYAQKLQTAFAERRPLLETDTNSYRLVYGENDGLPGLVADVYDKVVVLKLYAHCWIPHLPVLLPSVLETSGAETAVLRLSRLLQKTGHLRGHYDGEILHGRLPKEVVYFREHGVSFSANVIKGHKTGHFLDHRHNRRRIGEMASGKTVLDVFSYTGGFSIHALAGGAAEVTSLDISAAALKTARYNASLNPSAGRHILIEGDAFEELGRLTKSGKRYDIVVIDPPSFAKQAGEVAVAKKQYQRLAELGAEMVHRGGVLLLASCSSRIGAEDFYDWVTAHLRQAGYGFTILEKTQHDIDHPVRFPEGAYLKSIYLKVK